MAEFIINPHLKLQLTRLKTLFAPDLSEITSRVGPLFLI